MKPDLKTCLEMAKDVRFGQGRLNEQLVSLYVSQLERLVHAAWSAAEKEAASECVRICRDQAANRREGGNGTSCANEIECTFNLTETDRSKET